MDYEWDSGIPVCSPNAENVVETFLPSVARKSLWNANVVCRVILNLTLLF